ncbi:hypothetical protein ACP4OV_011270 [Aristida adscensionis]
MASCKIGIDSLMQFQNTRQFAYLPVLKQIEANIEWRAGVERMLQVLATKYSVDFDGLMHAQPS